MRSVSFMGLRFGAIAPKRTTVSKDGTSRETESNRRPRDYRVVSLLQSPALPTELSRVSGAAGLMPKVTALQQPEFAILQVITQGTSAELDLKASGLNIEKWFRPIRDLNP